MSKKRNKQTERLPRWGLMPSQIQDTPSPPQRTWFAPPSSSDADKSNKSATERESGGWSLEDMLTLDSFRNQLARTGFGTPNLLEGTEYFKTNFTQNYNKLTALYRENWIVKRLVDVVAEDMIKNWYRISSQLEPDSKRKITRLERRTQLRAKILDGLKWGRLYGGAVAVIVIDGHEDMLDEPLDYDFIMPGSFKGLIVVDRWSGVFPCLDVVEDINDPDFGLPEYYEITAEGFGMGVRVHHSRVLRFIGRRMPYIEELAETYWGTSEIEHVYSEITKYDNTSYNIASLVFQANVRVLKMEGFEQMATMSKLAMADLYNTLTMQNWMKSSQSLQVIGSKDSVEDHQYAFAGLADVMELFMLDVSGASAIPVTKLFGRSPAGMNATGESDMENYYDIIEEQQESTLKPILNRLLPIMCMSEFGAIPDDLDFEFEPVRRPTEEERKTLAKQTADAVVAVFNAGIISQRTGLKELKETARMTGMWNNITDEDIERADSDFGIGGEPPDIAAAQMTAEGETEQGDVPPEENPETLNGAQVTSLVTIVQSVQMGELPRDSGIQMIMAAFGYSREQAEGIIGDAGLKAGVISA